MSLDLSRDTRQSTEFGSQLVQAVATTSAVSILAPNDNEEIEITAIYISNFSNQNRYINVFHDKDGTTYDGTTAVVYQDTINASSPPQKLSGFIMNGSGNLAIQAQADNAITVTVYGYIRQKK